GGFGLDRMAGRRDRQAGPGGVRRDQVPAQRGAGRAQGVRGGAHPGRALLRHRSDGRPRQRPAAHDPGPGALRQAHCGLGRVQRLEGGFLRPEGPRLRRAGLVADAAFRAREGGGAGRWLAEVAAREPADGNRRAPCPLARPLRGGLPGRPGERDRRHQAHRPPGRRRGVDLGRPFQGPVRRFGSGAAARLAVRPHARRGQPALRRVAEPGRHDARSGGAAGAVRGCGRASRAAGRDLLRQRRHRVHPDAGAGARRPARGRGVRRLLDRMGLAARNPEGDSL
ncbi:MAG: 3-mercaptopyruvate sulfurtransferase, partial [uncultured Acetobacteraceae bacterium]